MATLISQNAISKGRGEKIKRKALDGPSPLDSTQATENGQGSGGLRTKKKKKERKEENKQEMEMKRLENSLFGSLYSPVEFGKDVEKEGNESSALFFMDRSANSTLSVYEEDTELIGKSENEEENKQRKPVWVDEEEEKASINIAKVNRLRKLRKEEDESVISGSAYVSRLRAQHVKLNPSTEWAQLDSQSRKYNSDDEDSDEENKEDGDVDSILRTTDDLVVKSSGKLLPGLLEHSRLVDANAEDPSSGPVNSVQFHRNAQLLLTGGLDKS